MKRAVVHVIGAGVSGLAAARALAASGRCDVVVHEARSGPGGRRRSFRDETLGLDVDLGNFPLLSGWRASLALVDAIGSRGEWVEDPSPGVAFADFAAGRRWRLAPNAGRLPWWMLLTKRRGPDVTPADYWAARRLLTAPADATVSAFAPKGGPAYERLWRPLTLAALNAEPDAASARLAGAALRSALGGGGRGLKILTPATTFGRAFVEPLARAAARHGASLRFGRRLVAVEFGPARLGALDFETDRQELGPRDGVILASSWRVAAGLVPEIGEPSGDSSVLTAHFGRPPPRDSARIMGAIHGAFQWMVCYGDRISVTIRDAGRLNDAPREGIAQECWRQAAALTGLADALPRWSIVSSRRATFPATPANVAARPAAATRWPNLFLAGGYVRQPLPDSVEAAVRSGEAAAQAFLSRDSG